MTAEPIRPDGDPYGPEAHAPTGLLDVLSVSAMVVDAEGRIVFWTPRRRSCSATPLRRPSAGTRHGC